MLLSYERYNNLFINEFMFFGWSHFCQIYYKRFTKKMECKDSLKALFVWLSYITKIIFKRDLEENVIQIFEHKIFLALIFLGNLYVLNLYGSS